MEPSEGKEVSWKIPVSNFSKGSKFSLNGGKQSEEILLEKLNVFDADEQVQKECKGWGSSSMMDFPVLAQWIDPLEKTVDSWPIQSRSSRQASDGPGQK